jgi:hypothetical protein
VKIQLREQPSGRSFSVRHAMAHALHPTQVRESTTMP